MKSRVERVFSYDDIAQIGNTYHSWSGDSEVTDTYADIPAFCRSVSISEIRDHQYVLTPAFYVGAEKLEEDSEVFAERMRRLTAQLRREMIESAETERQIRKSLASVGYDI